MHDRQRSSAASFRWTAASLALALLALGGTACTQSSILPTAEDVDVNRGAILFARDCAACHGADARGGRAPDLTTLSARNGGTFPLDQVRSTIYLGGGRSGATTMPRFGAQDMGQTVIVEHQGLGTPVPADLLALTTFLESVQG